MQRSIRAGAVLVVLASLVGCAYPRRSTSLSPANDASAASTAPPHLYRLTFVGASVPPRDRSGHEWDDDGSLPDPFVRLYRGDALVWESEVVSSSRTPRFDATLPRNVELSPRSSIRVELWDMDVTPQIIGLWRGQGLPANALPDAEAHVRLDGGADVAFRIDRPLPHRGVGIKTYEQRGDHLRVIEVEPFSPAARAGIVVGDEIVAIGGQRVSDLGDARAASAISLAAERSTPLVVKRAGGEETVELDRGYVWLAM